MPQINIYPITPGSTFDTKQNDDGSISLIERMVDNKIKGYDRALPDRVAAIRSNPRGR